MVNYLERDNVIWFQHLSVLYDGLVFIVAAQVD